MMQAYQYHPDPSVPGCCCSMPNGAKVAGIIEIVFAILSLIGGIYNVARNGDYYSYATIACAIGTIACSIFLIAGARHRSASKFLPFMVWKPIMLALQISGVIYSGVVGKKLWKEAADKEDWDANEREIADGIFNGIWGFALAFASVYILIGIINLYVVIMCYKHLRTHPPIPAAPPTVTYAYGQGQAMAVVSPMQAQYGQYPPQPYGLQQSYAYGQPASAPPPYATYDNQGMQDTAGFEK